MAPAKNAELELELDRLYQLPLDEFTPARNELASRLRADKRGDAAEHVKQLRKPPVAVWLVNQLARERELDVQRLAKAGEALAKSQANAASGRGPESFLEARRDERRALERLAQAARAIARSAGLSASTVDRATETLRAASLTSEGRDLLKRGRLTQELQPPGFEALSGLSGAAPRTKLGSAKSASDDKGAARRQALKDAREHLRELRSEEREGARAARSAERDAERAEQESAKLRAAATDAAEQAERATAARLAAEAEIEDLQTDRP